MKLFRKNKTNDKDYLSPELEEKLDCLGSLISTNKTEYILGHISEQEYEMHKRNYEAQIDELERSNI